MGLLVVQICDGPVSVARSGHHRCSAIGRRTRQWMLLKISLHKRAHGHNTPILRMSGVDRRLGENVAEMASAQSRRHFGMDEHERPRCTLVHEKGSLALNRELESTLTPVVDDVWVIHQSFSSSTSATRQSR